MSCIVSVGPRSRPPRGFTLIELLVVIAMIGFLFSLLLPAIHAARESAQSIEAANTTKTVCFALLND